MHCVVTAGPTYEELDRVRRLTNFSTGRLGSELAGYLSSKGHQVTLLLAEQATFRPHLSGVTIVAFTTTDDLADKLSALQNQTLQAVFHAAAVSDFRFGTVWLRSPDGVLREVRSGKLSTRDGDLLVELKPTPKIINHLRDWFPSATIIGWKYEVDGRKADVIEKARNQILECRTTACVANGPAYGEGFGIVRSGDCNHCHGQAALFEALEALLPAGI